MKHFDPNATIQLDRVDRLDDVQLDDIDAAANPVAPQSVVNERTSNAPRLSGRPLTSSGPPPLPPNASLPPRASVPPSVSYAPLPPRELAQKKPASKGKTVVQAVLFVALLGAAIVGGLKMGSSLRAAPPPSNVAAAPIIVQTPPPPSASVAAPPAPAVITMPTIEMSDPPTESK